MTAAKDETEFAAKQELTEIKYILSDDEHLVLENRKKKPDTFYLYFSVVSGLIVPFSGAAEAVWTSPVIPRLLSNNTDINPLGKPITTIQISLLVSIPTLAGLTGSLFLGKLSDRIGRKKFLQLVAFGMVLSNTALAFANQIEFIILLKCIFHVLSSGTVPVVLVFITEICEDHNRAKFGCLFSTFSVSGILYSFVFGPLFNFRNYTLVISLPPLLSLILLKFVQESPMYSLSKGDIEECSSTLRKLRSNKNCSELNDDLKKLKITLDANKNVETVNIFQLFDTREGKIGFLLGMGPMVFQILSGGPTMNMLMAPIFNEAGTSISGNTIAIISAIIQVLTFTFTSYIIEKVGRRLLLLISTIGCGIAVFVLGLLFYLKNTKFIVLEDLQWLLITCSSTYILLYSIGLGPIPKSMIGELFTLDKRSAALSAILTMFFLTNFMVSFIFPLLAEAVGMHWCFFALCVTCFLGAAFVFFFINEMRGRSIIEIQDFLKKYKFSFKSYG